MSCVPFCERILTLSMIVFLQLNVIGVQQFYEVSIVTAVVRDVTRNVD